jgi:hypothetical protein
MRTMYRKGMCKLLVMLMVMGGIGGILVPAGTGSAATVFAGGKGTISSPYQIETADQLNEVRNYDGVGVYFELIDDIDLSSYSEGEGWLPIGTASDRFNGRMNGNGFKITNLVINRPELTNVGLFGATEQMTLISDVIKSEIINMALENVEIIGGTNVGGLVGNNYGIISGCYITGTVSGNDGVGGLVGVQGWGSTSNSYSLANVSGANYVGGLLGINSFSTTSNSYAAGTVSGTGIFIGGMVGYYSSNAISGYYDSTTTNQTDVGKGEGKTTAQMQDRATFVGWNFFSDWYMHLGQYPQLWSHINLVQGTNAGTTQLIHVTTEMEYSLDGDQYTPVTDTSIDNINANTGDTIIVRFIDAPSSNTSLTVSLADIELTAAPAATLDGGTNAGTTKLVNVTSGMEYRVNSEPYVSITDTSVDNLILNAGNTITVRMKETAGQPESDTITLTVGLASISPGGGAVNALFAGGMGTIRDPYQIGTADQLNKVRDFDGVGIHFELIDDIDLNNYSDGDGFGWLPIGSVNDTFSGSINGNGFKITNLAINRTGITDVGLFGITSNRSVIENLILEDVNVIGNANVGGLVGNNYGKIRSSYTTGTVKGTNGIGGLVGVVSNGEINSSYSLVNVSGTSYVGGLVGLYAPSIVMNSYAAGLVKGTGISVGGLIGHNSGGITISSYYDKTTTTQTDTGKGAGKATSKMQDPATFAAWDFASQWYMLPGQYPQLWSLTNLAQGADIGTTKLTHVTTDMEYSLNGAQYTGVTGAFVDHINVIPGDIITVRLIATPSSARSLTVGISDISLTVTLLTSTITVDETQLLADGVSLATITVQLKDENGVNKTNSDDTVTLTSNLGVVGTVTSTVYGGEYTATITSSVAGIVTIRGQLDGDNIVDTATVSFIPGAASSETSTIEASPSTVSADGSSTTTITVQLKDTNGNLLITGGDDVSLSTNLGTLTAVTDHNNGAYSAQLSSATAGTATVTGAVYGSGLTATASVTFNSVSTQPPSSGSVENVVSNGDVLIVDNDPRSANDVGHESVEGNLVELSMDSARLNELLSKGKLSSPIVLMTKTASEQVHVALDANTFKAIHNNNPNAVVEIQTIQGNYVLPIHIIDRESIARQLGIDMEDIEITISIIQANETTTDRVNEQLSTHNLTSVSPIIEFKITAGSGEQTITINQFGSTYVNRIINLDTEDIDPAQTTGVVVDTETGEVQFVPSMFQLVDGKWQAVIKRNGNSSYMVVTNFKTFDDIAEHWAKSDIELLASKLIISGMTEQAFGAHESITRAQFSSLLVRALGLTVEKAAGIANNQVFSDIQAGAWYEDAVRTAVGADLISGYSDHTFRPHQAITRQEMAVILNRAINYASDENENTVDHQLILARYLDQHAIASWAQEDVAKLVDRGLIQGYTEESFAPTSSSTRGEAAALLARMLRHLGFMN